MEFSKPVDKSTLSFEREVSMGTLCFSPKFKEEAVRSVTERGYFIAEVSERLGVSAHNLYKWLWAVEPNSTG